MRSATSTQRRSSHVRLKGVAAEIYEGPSPEYGLLSWHQLQAWERDNPFILSGYRPLTNSYYGCYQTLLGLHNQTVNIWSHFLGAIIYAATGVYMWLGLSEHYSTPTRFDAFVFGCYFVSVVACLSFSVCFHLFSNHSHAVHDRFLYFDFLGILGLILGSWIPGIYYGFYCDALSSRFYWILITSITLACTALITIPRCRQPVWKPLRTSMFIALGLSGILPMYYAVRMFGVEQAHRQMGWGFFCLEGVFYMGGALLYAAKVPERFLPGTFDIVGASHQIFHLLVLCGAGAHLAGIVKAFHFNHDPATRLCEYAMAAW